MTAYNSIEKISRRSVEDLEGLNIGLLESSEVDLSLNNATNITYIDKTTNNTMSKLSRRKISELNGLLITIIENSTRNISANGVFKLINPKKTYNSILRLYKSYVIKIELLKKYITQLKD